MIGEEEVKGREICGEREALEAQFEALVGVWAHVLQLILLQGLRRLALLPPVRRPLSPLRLLLLQILLLRKRG